MSRLRRRWIFLLAAVFALPVVLVVTVWTWGSFLPETHRVTGTRALERDVAEVWALIADFEGAAAWRPGVESVTVEERADGLHVREVNVFGELHYRVEESTPPTRLVTRIVDHPDFSGRWIYELTPTAAGCTLSITEDGAIHGAAMRFFAHVVVGLDATVEGYLTALAAEVG